MGHFVTESGLLGHVRFPPGSDRPADIAGGPKVAHMQTHALHKKSRGELKGVASGPPLPLSTCDVIRRRRRANVVPAGVDAVDDGVEPGVAGGVVAEHDVRGSRSEIVAGGHDRIGGR